jgi:hypothetical protein
MFKLKTIILILLLVVIAYQIYKLYSYNFNIVNTSQKILLNSIEKHNNEIMNRIQLLEENVDIKMSEYYKKINDVYNKTTEINKMNNQTIINQYNQYDDNDNNQNNNFIYNSDESNPIGVENNKNPFIKPNVIDKELYMSSNSSSSTQDNSVIQIEQNVLQRNESETSVDEKSINKEGDGGNGGDGEDEDGGGDEEDEEDEGDGEEDVHAYTVPEMFRNIYNQNIKVIDITDKITVVSNNTPININK